MVNPPSPKPPTFRKFRREKPSQNGDVRWPGSSIIAEDLKLKSNGGNRNEGYGLNTFHPCFIRFFIRSKIDCRVG